MPTIKNNRYLLALGTVNVRAFWYVIPPLLLQKKAGMLPV